MRILWISPRWPWPANSGATKASLALIAELKKAALLRNQPCELQLVCLYENVMDLASVSELEACTQTHQNLYLPKPALWGASVFWDFVKAKISAPRTPYTISRYCNAALASQLRQWTQGQSWDYTVLDGLHGAAFVNLEDPCWGHLIYRAHNVESDIWRQLSKRPQPWYKSLVLKKEFQLYQRYERNICQRSRWVLPVSDLDAGRFLELGLANNARAVPIGVSFEGGALPFPPGTDQGVEARTLPLQLLFVGRLDWLPNKDGLQWFLNSVWPELLRRRPHCQLTIIGSGESTWLNSHVSPKIEVLRNVADLEPYYARAHLSLIPLFMGSGTRVKAIESGRYGRSFISTSLGVEGLPFVPGVDYVLAETAEEWITVLSSLPVSELQKKAAQVYETAAKSFEQRTLAGLFLELISKPV